MFVAIQVEKPVINFRAYATRHNRNQISVTLINKERGLDSIVTIAGAERHLSKTILRLSAQSLDAPVGIELGGSTVDGDGSWHPTSDENIRVDKRKLLIHLPAASAAVLTLEP